MRAGGGHRARRQLAGTASAPASPRPTAPWRRACGAAATVDAAALPHAADVARLACAAFARGEAIAPERIEPAYLRNNVALTLAEQQALRAAR